MQFEAQRRTYQSAYPRAQDSIICLQEDSIGRILVDREPGAMHLIDIALRGEYRGRGIGGALIRQLMRECETHGWPLRLQVLQTNPAVRLYRRLGFAPRGGDPIYMQMEWAPSG